MLIDAVDALVPDYERRISFQVSRPIIWRTLRLIERLDGECGERLERGLEFVSNLRCLILGAKNKISIDILKRYFETELVTFSGACGLVLLAKAVFCDFVRN